MAKMDIEKVLTEYYMLRTVLQNKYSMDVLTGKVKPSGPSASADLLTLQAIERYVKALGKLEIEGNGLSANETLDEFLARYEQNYLDANNARVVNPFEDDFKYYVKNVLSSENAGKRIEQAITNDPNALNSVNSLVVNLGGKKQSSFIKILAQSTNLFSEVSSLEKQLEKKKAAGAKSKDEIKQLKELLAQKTQEAENYKKICDEAIERLADIPTYTMLVAMLKQTSDTLEGTIKKESALIREEVRREGEATRGVVVDLSTAKAKIEKYIVDHISDFPRYKIVYTNSDKLNKRGMTNLYKEITYAAKKVGLAETHPAVTEIYNDLAKEQLKNDKPQLGGTTKKSGKAGKIITGSIALLLIGTTTFFAAKYFTNQNQPKPEPITVTQTVEVDRFHDLYNAYEDREMAQYNAYTEKLNYAVVDGTLVELPGLEATPGSSDGTVWNQESLQNLRNEYAADDYQYNGIDLKQEYEVDWSSTQNIDLVTAKTIQNVKADYYKTHYEEVVQQVSNLTIQINNLTIQINEANGVNAELQSLVDQLTEDKSALIEQINQLNGIIDQLRGQVVELQGQISTLQSVLDAANAQNAALQSQLTMLQSQLNSANARITELETQVAELTAENADLKQQVASLQNRIGQLENQIEGLNGEISRLEGENQTLATEKAALILQVADLQAQVDALRKQVQEMGDSEALYQEKVALEQRVAELEGQLTAANQRISELESANEALTNQIVSLQNTISELNGKINDLTNTINNLTTENQNLREQVSSLEQSLTESINAYNDLYDKYQQLLASGSNPEEIARLEGELNSAYALIQSYEQRIVQLYNGITKDGKESSEAAAVLEELFRMFGINYSESDSPENSNTEYQP